MPKKFLGLFLSFALMFSVAIPTFAATDVAAKGRVRIDAENFDECYDPTTTVVTMAGLDPRYVSFNRDEWMDYTLNVAVEGDYRLTVLGAIDPSSATASLTVSVNEKDVLNGTVGKTTGWTDFEEHDFGLIHLKKGTSVLRFYSHGSGFHFDYFILEREAADKMQVDFSRQSGAYRKAVLPTAIEAENYDLGETGSFALTEKIKRNTEQTDRFRLMLLATVTVSAWKKGSGLATPLRSKQQISMGLFSVATVQTGYRYILMTILYRLK